MCDLRRAPLPLRVSYTVRFRTILIHVVAPFRKTSHIGRVSVLPNSSIQNLAVLIFTLRHTHVLQYFWKGLIVLNMTVIALDLGIER